MFTRILFMSFCSLLFAGYSFAESLRECSDAKGEITVVETIDDDGQSVTYSFKGGFKIDGKNFTLRKLRTIELDPETEGVSSKVEVYAVQIKLSLNEDVENEFWKNLLSKPKTLWLLCRKETFDADKKK